MARAMTVYVRGGTDRRLFLSTAASDPGYGGVMTTDDKAPSTLSPRQSKSSAGPGRTTLEW